MDRDEISILKDIKLIVERIHESKQKTTGLGRLFEQLVILKRQYKEVTGRDLPVEFLRKTHS